MAIQDWANLATISQGVLTAVGLVLAVIVAIIARDQVIANREAAALDAFLSYMQTVLHCSEFDEPDYDVLLSDKKEYIRYRRFVGYAFTACERMLLYGGGQDYWRETVLGHVERHRKFICSKEFIDKYELHYSPPMRTLFAEARRRMCEGSEVAEAELNTDSSSPDQLSAP